MSYFVDFSEDLTRLEITVVSMAALAVVTMIAMRGNYPWFRRDLLAITDGGEKR